ncbi:uncharacterized protein K02A2.6-like [Ornithodoros turicata]|uniref:uncharacterized protein K02A2.6-like n=1 Tax=Ornithodoros turicata TaxID=34597 RepID=UPI003139B359
MVTKYPAVFRDGLGRCTKTKVHLELKPDSQPKFFKARPIPFSIRTAVERDLERQVANGVLSPIETSSWATSIVVVPKPNGAVRVCRDFSVTVNPQLDIAQYPLPRPEELFAKLNGGVIFSKLDLSEAYLQMELDDDAKKVLVVNTHTGLFQFHRMPFGIASAPAIFQRTIEQVTARLDYVACYLDDIIVTGTTLEHHLSNLAKVFQRLSDFGFTLKKEKCAFFKQEVEYLGQIVSKEGFRPSPKKISAILNMPEPQFRWYWSSECVEAFETVKLKLSAPGSLAHYDPARPLFLAADASSKGLGAVMFHRIDGKERPIARASKTLTSAEKKYAQIEREALAIIFGVKKFHEYLWGRRFTLYTDHKPLTTIFGPYKGIPVTAANRLQRWAFILMSYSFDIIYKPTTDIGNAVGLPSSTL